MRPNGTFMYLVRVSIILLVLCLISGVQAGEGVREAAMKVGNGVRDQFLGTWDLISYEVRRSDGTAIYPFGRDPKGQLMYDNTGHMSANLMHPDRPNFRSGQRGIYTEEEIRAAWTGYIGYCGTFSIDEKASTVTHHVRVAAFPNWVGSDQVRTYEFLKDGQQLLLSAGPASARAYLLWARAEKSAPR